MDIRSMTRAVEEASARYAERNGIERTDDWLMLKLGEEVGELTQAYLALSGRSRDKGRGASGLAEDLRSELSDVLGQVLLIAHRNGIDLEQALEEKWLARLRTTSGSASGLNAEDAAAGLHHVEVWVTDLPAAREEWGWLLGRVGLVREAEWPEGASWGGGDAYITVTTSPNLIVTAHDRRRPGVNHLAFRGGAEHRVDAIMAEAPAHGWTPLYHDRYPHAGGPQHYAGWLENSAGFKVEVVAEASGRR